VSSTVSVGGFEISSNHESAAEMVEVLKPAGEDAKQPRIIKDGGKPVEESPLSEAARELGKAGGEASAKAKKEAKEAEAKPEKAEKPAEKEPEAKEAKPDDEGDPRTDPKARIRELARERAEERAQRLAIQEELAKLRAEYAAPKKALVEDESAPKLEDFPNNYEGYVEAIAGWKAEQKFKEFQQQAEQQREANAHAEAIAAKVEAFNERVKEDPDYLTKVDPRILDLKPAFMLAPGETLAPSNVIAEALVTSEQTVELSLYLSANSKEMERLLKLPNPAEIWRAVGQLEIKLAAKADEPQTETVSKAPAPFKPITASAVPGEPDLTSDMDFDTYSRRRSVKR
jgi:hypothetical protein